MAFFGKPFFWWYMLEKKELETGSKLAPSFDANGLIPVIAQDFKTKDVLMMAYMNEEALNLTLETEIAHYWSRSRNSIWKKGETSGQLQHVKEFRIDCDQDCILLLVEVGGNGGCCHVGYADCFYRIANIGEKVALVIDGKKL